MLCQGQREVAGWIGWHEIRGGHKQAHCHWQETGKHAAAVLGPTIGQFLQREVVPRAASAVEGPGAQG